ISPSGKKKSYESDRQIPFKGRAVLKIPYVLDETCPRPAAKYSGHLLYSSGRKGDVILDATPLRFTTWTTPIDLTLATLYLRPEQKQLIRMNFGLSSATMAKVSSARLELVRRGTGKILKTWDVAATPAALKAQRARIPVDLRGDFTNLLLTDLDVS